MDAQQSKDKEYRRKTASRNVAVVPIFSISLILSFIVSINTGYLKLPPSGTLRTLLSGGSSKENLILFGFRLSHIVISMLMDAELALSSCIIQEISRDAPTDPGLLGINAGVGLTVILLVLFFGSQFYLSVFTPPFLALLGGGLAAILIYALAYRHGGGLTPIRLILTGVAAQAGLSALTTMLAVELDETQFDFMATWQAGSIWDSSWKFVPALLLWLLLLIPYVLSRSRALDVLNLGDDIVYGLGASVGKEHRRLFVSVVVLTASYVTVSGSISFVGLAASHLARRLVGPRRRVLLPTCALTGVVLVSVSDTVARVIVQPFEISTGIMVAIISAPYFLYLLVKNKQWAKDEIVNSTVIQSLTVAHEGDLVVDDLDMQVLQGRITTIIGPNGCGKSTALKAVDCILKPRGGIAYLNGDDTRRLTMKGAAQKMAIPPQSPQVSAGLTVRELVTYGRLPHQRGFGKLIPEGKRTIQRVLEATRLMEFKATTVDDLFDEQRQRVWIAMTLAQQTDLILLDESTAYLDLVYQLEVLELLYHLNQEQGYAIVMVLHDLNLAIRFTDHMIVIRGGDTTQHGTPEEVMTAEVLKEAFHIDAETVKEPHTGHPTYISYDLIRQAQDITGIYKKANQ